MKLLSMLVAAVSLLSMVTANAVAQTSALTYQGSLEEAGGFADGLYDMRFRLYAQPSGGPALGAVIIDDVEVSNGLFSVEIDFGYEFEFGSERFLDITVRRAGDPGFTVLEPRVRLTSAPSAHVAGHADTADIAAFALDGPFAPEDTTPASASGAPGQTVSVNANFAGTAFTDMELSNPIRIEREIFGPGGQQSGAGPHEDFTIELRRAYDPSSPFYFQFQQFTGFVDITITTGAGGSNASSFEFEGGGITGYKLESDGPNLYEVVSVTYAQPSIPVPLSTFASRSASGYTESPVGPHQPYLGGNGALPGVYRYTIDFSQSSFLYSSVGAFPNESREVVNGNPGPPDFEAVSILLNVFEDPANVLWDRFSGSGTPFVITLQGPGGSVVWEPGFGFSSTAYVQAWELGLADDGGLYETYEIFYAPDKP